MNTPTGIEYQGLLIQRRARRVRGKTEKALVTFDESLKLLRKAGYQRHLRPAEAFRFLAEGLEEKLTPEQKTVHDDMLTSHGEWMSLAMERQGDKLITYLDPEGLVWNRNEYVKERGFKFTEKMIFYIRGKASQVYLDLNLFDEQLVQYVYGRAFADFPSEMKKGSNRVHLYLPAEGIVRPVSRDLINDRFNADGFDCRSVRGVASVGAKK